MKQVKRVGSQLKEFQREADEARASREEMSAQYKDLERKMKNMETELMQYQEDLAAAERARKVPVLLFHNSLLAKLAFDALFLIVSFFLIFYVIVYTRNLLIIADTCSMIPIRACVCPSERGERARRDPRRARSVHQQNDTRSR